MSAVVPPPKRSRTVNGFNESTATQLQITSREHEFSATTWWLVDVESKGISQGATPLVKRCMRVHGWDIAKARKVLKAYRQFLDLKKHHEDWDATCLSPSFLVDQMWHQHILDVVNYCHDMMLLCGHVVGHNPDGADDIQGKVMRDKRTREGLEELFDGDYDKEIWGISSNVKKDDNSSNDERENKYLILNITLQGFSTSYRLKRSDCLWPQLTTFANMRGEEIEDVEFRYNGVLIDELSSPKSMDVGQGVQEIDVKATIVNVDVSIYRQGDYETFTSCEINRSSSLSACFGEFAKSHGRRASEFQFMFEHSGVIIDGRTTLQSLLTRFGFDPDDSIKLQLKFFAFFPNEVRAIKDAAGDRQITIRVKDQSGEETFFKVKTHTRMSKIFNAYASRKGVDQNALRFLLDGLKIYTCDTPMWWELEDHDQIDAILEQVGC